MSTRPMGKLDLRALLLMPQLLVLMPCCGPVALCSAERSSASGRFKASAQAAGHRLPYPSGGSDGFGIQCLPQAPRTDCGYFGIQQPECESRGCCWSPAAAATAERVSTEWGFGASSGHIVAGDGGLSAHQYGDGGSYGGGNDGVSEVAAADVAASQRCNDLPWCFFPNGQEQEAVYLVESVQPAERGSGVTTILLRLRPSVASPGPTSTTAAATTAATPTTSQKHQSRHQHHRTNHSHHHKQQQRQCRRQGPQRPLERRSGPSLGPDCLLLEVRVEEQAAHRLYIRVQPAGQQQEAQTPPPAYAAVAADGVAATGSGASAGGGGSRPPATARGRRGDVSGAQGEKRWRVPEELLPRPPTPAKAPDAPLYQLRIPAMGQEFRLQVTRADKSIVEGTSGKSTSFERGSNRARRAMHSSGGGDAAGGIGAGYGDASRGQVLLDLSGAGCLVFKPQYLQVRAQVPPDINLYGMGETTQAEGIKLRCDGSTRALWNSDTAASAIGVNLYGSHPVLYGISPASGGASFGWFLANSNAMDFVPGIGDVTFRMVGGVVELFVFCGPTPEQVTSQYQEVVGRPAMPPRWSLGFHQSRWGYGSVEELEQVVSSYDREGIPLEVLWSDIDYTDRARMFTLDPLHYPQPKLRALVDSLHATGRRWVPIVDCGITALPDAGYEPYERGLSYDVFMKDSSGKPLVGQVWSGPTHWPDFLHPNATPYWASLLGEMHDKLPYDGIWLDMNEPSNFCTGECKPPPLSATVEVGLSVAPTSAAAVAEAADGEKEEKGDGVMFEAVAAAAAASAAADASVPNRLPGPLGISCVLECTQPSPDDPLSNPPYRVNNGNHLAPLYSNTLPMTAVGYGGVRQYDAHNLYALAESRVTYTALEGISPGYRPFILTRSSWSGQGRYSAHWSGDNTASWDDLRRSPSGLLTASLEGMAMAGADICGFMGTTNEQLCARWLAAGAFYTFARDHSDRGSSPQEPYRWPLAAEAARNSLKARYSLLPYLYTAFYLAHTRGGTVARPLAWIAPADPWVADLYGQWLLGDALMVAPVLAPDTDWVEVHFPGADHRSQVPVRTGGSGSTDRESSNSSSSSSSDSSSTASYNVRRSSGTWCRYGDLADCYTGPSQHLIHSPLGAAPPLFLRAGCIIPTQPPDPTAPAQPLTTALVAASPVTLIVLLSAAGSDGPRLESHFKSKSKFGSGFDFGRVGIGSGESKSTLEPTDNDGPGCGLRADITLSRDLRDDLVSYGLLYADNGTDTEVGGRRSLRAEMAAGASSAAGWGWVEYRVTSAPKTIGQVADGGDTTISATVWGADEEEAEGGSAAAGADVAAAEAATSSGGADLDVRQLRVATLLVVGLALPPGCVGLEVEVEVAGSAPIRLEAGVRFDPAAHQLRVEGLELSAVESFRLTWKPQGPLPPPPPPPSTSLPPLLST